MNIIDCVRISFESSGSSRFEQAEKQLDDLIKTRNSNGYKVVSVTPVISGHSDYDNTENQSYGYGYGYTSGFVIIFEMV